MAKRIIPDSSGTPAKPPKKASNEGTQTVVPIILPASGFKKSEIIPSPMTGYPDHLRGLQHNFEKIASDLNQGQLSQAMADIKAAQSNLTEALVVLATFRKVVSLNLENKRKEDSQIRKSANRDLGSTQTSQDPSSFNYKPDTTQE